MRGYNDEGRKTQRYDFCRSVKQRKLQDAADRLLAKSGFFRPEAETLEFPNDPTMQEAYDKHVGAKLTSDAVSPLGHLRATWTGTIQPTDILTRD